MQFSMERFIYYDLNLKSKKLNSNSVILGIKKVGCGLYVCFLKWGILRSHSKPYCWLLALNHHKSQDEGLGLGLA